MRADTWGFAYAVIDTVRQQAPELFDAQLERDVTQMIEEAVERERAFGARNAFAFMELQDVAELANFFERRVSAYQVGVSADIVFGEDFEPGGRGPGC